MGWSWALWVLHTIVVATIVPCLPLGEGSLVLDKAPPPVPRLGRPIACVYVDNVSALGVDRRSVSKLWRAICECLEAAGLHLHEFVAPHGALELVGLVLVAKPVGSSTSHRGYGRSARLRRLLLGCGSCMLGNLCVGLVMQ